MKIQANFKELTEGKRFKRKDSEDPEDKEKRRPREDKGSTADAKGLKPDVLETSMP